MGRISNGPLLPHEVEKLVAALGGNRQARRIIDGCLHAAIRIDFKRWQAFTPPSSSPRDMFRELCARDAVNPHSMGVIADLIAFGPDNPHGREAESVAELETIILVPEDFDPARGMPFSRLFSTGFLASWSRRHAARLPEGYVVDVLSLADALAIREQYTDQPLAEELHTAVDRDTGGDASKVELVIGTTSRGERYLKAAAVRHDDGICLGTRLLYRLRKSRDSVVVGAIAGHSARKIANVSVPIVTDGGELRSLEEVERDVITCAFYRLDGRMSMLARKLGIGRSTLYRKLADLGIKELQP